MIPLGKFESVRCMRINMEQSIYLFLNAYNLQGNNRVYTYFLMHMVVNFFTHIFHLIQVSKHSIPLFFPSFLHSLFNGRNCLFFVFVRNANPKTEMEDTNTDTNKSGSSSPSGSPLRTGRCPLPTMRSPSPFSRSPSPLSLGSSPSGSPSPLCSLNNK